MWRSRPTRFVVSLGVGTIIAALAGLHAFGQTTDRPSTGTLRSTIDDNDDTPRRDRKAAPRARSKGPNVGELPTSVGTTGFDSTNRTRRTALPKQRPAAAATSAPLSLTPALAPPLPLVPGMTPTGQVTTAPVPATTPTTATTTTTSSTAAAATAAPTTGTPAATGSTAPIPRGTAPRASALVRVPSSAAADAETSVVNTTNFPANAATLLRRRTALEDDAFAQLGVRASAFLVLPAIEVATGFDTNPARTPDGRGSWFTVVSPELLARSDWQRHEVTATLRGSYSTYAQTPELDRPAFDGKITGRFDVTRDSRALFEGLFVIGTDNPGSPNVQAGLRRFPIFTTLGAAAGFAQRFNRVDVTVKGTVERTQYQDSEFTDGATESNRDRDFNRYGGLMRVTYDLMPGLRPFVEAGGDTRVHDLEVDRFGLQRDSTGWTVKAGSSFEFSRKLTGEVAVGYLERTYKDPSLQELNGITIDGSLLYALSALTNVKLTAATTAAETTVPGTAGVFTRDTAITVEHAFRRWLIGSLRFGYGFDDYVGSDRKDDRFALSGTIVYKLNRIAQVKAEVRREWLRSSVPGNDYDAMVYLLGIRLQR